MTSATRTTRRATLAALLCGALGLAVVAAPSGAPARAAGQVHDDARTHGPGTAGSLPVDGWSSSVRSRSG